MIGTPELLDGLREGVHGLILTAPAAVAPYAANFSRLVSRVPRVVLVPSGEEDLVHALRVARALGVSVTVRGSGHSGHAYNLSSGGLLIANTGDHATPRLLPDGRVEVSAATSWHALQRALTLEGRTMPVLPDYLGLTIGGTLAVGGYGVHSFAHGSQVEWVERLRLIMPDGTACWCSPAERVDLFRASLAGLGQVGIIERVVLRTLPYRELTDLYRCAHRTVDDLIDTLELACAERDMPPDSFDAVCVPGQILSYYGRSLSILRRALLGGPAPLLGRVPARYLTTVAHAWLAPYESVREWARPYLPHDPDHHMWVFYAVRLSALRAFLRLCEHERRHGPSAPYLPLIHLLAIRPPVDPHLLTFAPSSLPGADFVAGVGLYYRISFGDRDGVRIVRAAIRRLLEHCLKLGGRPYRFGCDELREAEAAMIYGPAWAALDQLREALDPHRLFGGPAGNG